MLAVKDEASGKGLGKLLVNAAEQESKKNGCTHNRMELLTPLGWEHPVKKWLHAWYTRLGYVAGESEPFSKRYSHMCHLFSCSC